MGDVHYMISEAAKRVNVETHVLRYWEEELELPIGRTEMGHRYYTEEDIQLFRCIKELKEQGMFLKDLKSIIPDMLRLKEGRTEKAAEVPDEPPEDLREQPIPSKEEDRHLESIQAFIREALLNIVADNNKTLQDFMTKSVSEKIIKEVDFMLQAKGREEEDRYRKLDYLIRQQQSLRKEAARTPGRRLRRLLGAGEY